MVRTQLGFLTLILVLASCDEPAPLDAGPDAGGEDSSTATVCERQADCEDGLFCTVDRCEPGAASADASGCVQEPACAATDICDDDADQCTTDDCTNPDEDGDNDFRMTCGGGDCDDDDGRRASTFFESCDAADLDEDCNPLTFAGADDGDLDGDGFISEDCCNGLDCGDDCAPNDRAIFPGATETCDGRDEDCDGRVDEQGPSPLCPGTVCRAGRCDYRSWERVFGDDGSDAATAIALDPGGNVYVVGSFRGSLNLGLASGPLTSAGESDIFVLSLDAAGGTRWARTVGSSGNEFVAGAAVSGLGDSVCFTADSSIGLDYAGGPPSGTPQSSLVCLDLDGAYQWSVPVPSSGAVAATPDGLVVTGFLTDEFTIGGTTLTPVGLGSYVVRFDNGGVARWARALNGSSSEGTLATYSVDASAGRIAISGACAETTVALSGEPGVVAGNFDVFAVVLDADAGTALSQVVGVGPGFDTIGAILLNDDGSYLVGGGVGGSFEIGGLTLSASGGAPGFLAVVDRMGEATLLRPLTSEGSAIVRGLARTESERIAVTGSFAGRANFGGNTLLASSTANAFYVEYDDSLNFQREVLIQAPSPCPQSRCRSSSTLIATGTADLVVIGGYFDGTIDLGFGPRTAATNASGETTEDVWLLSIR